jgi:transcriptional regulator with XRE-family HTH domain
MDKDAERRLGRSIGEALARQRQRVQMTQEQVAERLGVERETISRFERGTVVPPVPRLYELAEAYGCRVEEFLSEGSLRESDQASHIARMLDGMKARDRTLAMNILRELSEHLR